MHKNLTRILPIGRFVWTNSALVGFLWFLTATMIHAAEPVASLSSADLDKQVGQAVDIASSAYQYRADRKTEENAPESWIAIMRFAGQPLNAPADVQAPAVKQVLRAFLWEENRPIKQVELTWSPEAKRRPGNNDLVFSSLTGPTWWSKPRPNGGVVSPKVSPDGNTWVIPFAANTCGLVLSVKDGAKSAADYDMPTVRILVAEVWKKMDIEIEWGFDQATAEKDYSGRIETYDGRVSPVVPLDGDGITKVMDTGSWGSNSKAANRRGIKCSLLYMGTSTWRKTIPYHNFQEDVARSIITVWTKSGNFSFLAADLEHGPILAPEYGFFVRRTSTLATPAPATEAPISLASNATNARDFLKELQGKNQKTVRQMIRAREEQTWEGAVTGLCGTKQPPHPKVSKEAEPAMKVEVPSERLTAQWNLGPQHIAAAAKPNPKTGRKWFNDHPYGILAAETFMILTAHDQMGAFKDAEDGFFQWVSLPIDQKVSIKKGPNDPNGVHHQESLPDRPIGLFTDGSGSLTLAEGWGGRGGNMDGVHAFGPGSIGWSLIEHYRLSGDTKWFKEYGPRIKANAEWMLRQRHSVEKMLPGGERLWCKGIQPAMNMTPDGGQFLMHFYEAQGFYLAAVESCAQALVTIDPEGGAKLLAEAAAYRKDLQAAVERTIALSPVVPVRDGTYHSIIPFACYVRGFATGAWGWLRNSGGSHAGLMYWETVQNAGALISPAKVLPAADVRVQGWLDVLEDRLLLENERASQRCSAENITSAWTWTDTKKTPLPAREVNPFLAGYQYQVGLERTACMHLDGDDVSVFIRSFMNGYAAHILPEAGYVFNEHVGRGPPNKVFEESSFRDRFRNMLVMEDGQTLWLARATPRVWLEQGKKISIKNAPTHFGTLEYDIVSDVDNGKINATVNIPSRTAAKEIWLRLRHPKSAPIKSVTVNGKDWKDFNKDKETITIKDLTGTVAVTAQY